MHPMRALSAIYLYTSKTFNLFIDIDDYITLRKYFSIHMFLPSLESKNENQMFKNKLSKCIHSVCNHVVLDYRIFDVFHWIFMIKSYKYILSMETSCTKFCRLKRIKSIHIEDSRNVCIGFEPDWYIARPTDSTLIEFLLNLSEQKINFKSSDATMVFIRIIKNPYMFHSYQKVKTRIWTFSSIRGYNQVFG